VLPSTPPVTGAMVVVKDIALLRWDVPWLTKASVDPAPASARARINAGTFILLMMLATRYSIALSVVFVPNF